MSGGERRPWWLGPAAVTGAAALRVLATTWRVRYVNAGAHDRRVAAGGQWIYAIWHSRVLPCIHEYGRLGVAALVSQSRDGELIARVIERAGFVVARGSSTRGGQEGFLELVRHAQAGRSITIMPDGPRGPREVLKPGVIRLASRTGLPVLPVASASRRPWVARSWDGFRVPRPFAGVVIGYGDAIEVPRDLDDAGVERWRRQVEAALGECTARTDREAGEGA